MNGITALLLVALAVSVTAKHLPEKGPLVVKSVISPRDVVVEAPGEVEPADDAVEVDNAKLEIDVEDLFLPNGCPKDPYIPWSTPNKHDCDKYFVCIWGKRVSMQCPAPLHFNRLLQVCDWPEVAGCHTIVVVD